jgi:hypothetical protein
VLAYLRERIAHAERESAHADEVHVWPEHWHAALVFAAMGSQWRTVFTPGGEMRYEGLRYEALAAVVQEHAGMRHAQPFAVLMRQLRYLERRAVQFVNGSD